MRSWAPCLGHRHFRIYYSGQLANWFGTWMQQLALGWWVYRLTDSAGWLAAVAVCSQLPILILGPWAATMADHVERRKALMVTQALSLVQALALLAIYLSGSASVAMLLACALALGVVGAFDIPIRQSYQAHLVPEKDVSNAVAIMAASANFTRLLAPALAGLLIAWVGEGVCFAVNAASYLAILVTLSKLPRQAAAAERTVGVGAWGSFAEGARHALADPWMALGMALALGMSLFATPYLTLMPALARSEFGAGAELYGMAMGMSGLGAMAAGLALAARPRWLGRARMAGLGIFGAAALGSMTRMPNAYWAMPLLFFTGFGLSGSINIANATIQRRVDSAMRGRVMGLFSMCLYGAAPLGAIAMGAAAELWGTRVAMGAGAALAALSFAGMALRSRQLRRLDLAAKRERLAPADAALAEEVQEAAEEITPEEAWAASMPERVEVVEVVEAHPASPAQARI